jgi:hypothetical protein
MSPELSIAALMPKTNPMKTKIIIYLVDFRTPNDAKKSTFAWAHV